MKTIAKATRTRQRNLALQKPKSDSAKKPVVKPKRPGPGKRNNTSLNFYYKRTSFRAQIDYLKACLKPHKAELLSVKKLPNVLQMIEERFCQVYQPGLLAKLNLAAKRRYLNILKMLIFSHLYKKKATYLAEEPGISYEVVREPSYKYSNDAKDRFFQEPELAFLFVFIGLDQNAKAFREKKFSMSNKKDHPQFFHNEIENLSEEAM